MLKISFRPSFIKQFNKLEKNLQDEVLEKIEFFKDSKNHKLLKVHKLHGPLKNYYSFSVNYQTRIVFLYGLNKEIHILMIGDHNIYN